MTQDKRLIEHYIPIKAISAEASHEKSIRHGHISTLHLWWARRPLVASRAAVFAALVSADAKPKLTVRENSTAEPRPMTMTEFMVELCKWDLRDEILEEARRLIREVYPDNPPKVLDMFAGGGAIPLEALRLGAEAYALDLNPVAHIIQLATLVYPQKYGKKLAEDVQKWGDWVLERVREEIGDLYPLIPDPDYDPEKFANEKTTQMGLEDADGGADFERDEITQLAMDFLDGDEDIDWDDAPDGSTVGVPDGWLQPIIYMWTRAVTCPNPTCHAAVPLVRQTWLKKKKGDYVALEMLPHPTENRMAFHVRTSAADTTKNAIDDYGFDPADYSKRGTTTCHRCGTTVTSSYVKSEGTAGRMYQQMMSTICIRQGSTGKIYLSPDDTDLPVPLQEDIEARLSELAKSSNIQPLYEQISGDNRAFAPPLYGLENYSDIFNARQTYFLFSMIKSLHLAYQQMLDEGYETEQAEGVVVELAMWIDRLADQNSTLCTLYPIGGRGVVHTFVRQVLPMVWDYAESNPLGRASSNVYSALDYAIRAINTCVKAKGIPAIVQRASATEMPFESATFDTVVTDPPYYDNVPYADLSDYFYIWLKRSLGHIFPQHLTMDITPKKKEAVAASHRHGDIKDKARQFYEDMMFQSFMEANRVLKDDGTLVTVYAHKTTAGWSTLVDALRKSSFTITEAWPLDTELPSRMRGQNSAALASSFFLVARKRENGHTGDYVNDVQEEMKRIVAERVKFFLQVGITGADLNIAAVGAGLAPYTRYARVELPNGEELGVADYLEEVQAEVVKVLLGEASQTDPATQYYIMARDYYGVAWVDFDEANNLARATGIELDTGPDALTKGKDALIEKNGSKVRLLTYAERGESDSLGIPTADQPVLSLIDVLHRLLWLVEHDNSQIDNLMNAAMPEKYLLRLTAEALKGKALASEPTPGAVRDDRSPEQRAIDTLLASWRRVVEEGKML